MEQSRALGVGGECSLLIAFQLERFEERSHPPFRNERSKDHPVDRRPTDIRDGGSKRHVFTVHGLRLISNYGCFHDHFGPGGHRRNPGDGLALAPACLNWAIAADLGGLRSPFAKSAL